MFLSFAAFGAMPLLGYVIIPISIPELGRDVLFKAACLVTGIVLFFLGSVKSKFAYVRLNYHLSDGCSFVAYIPFFLFRNAHWFSSGLETLVLGGTCATVAFTIGYYVNEMFDTGESEL